MLYDGHGDSVGGWGTGYATSPDGVTWTKYASNPVLQAGASGVIGGTTIQKVGSTYWLWVIYFPTYVLPTDIRRYYSTDLINWTASPSGFATLPRLMAIDGPDEVNGQTADPWILEVNGETYLWYASTWDQTTFKINVAKYNGTVAQLVATDEIR
jgi:hypothetical protein